MRKTSPIRKLLLCFTAAVCLVLFHGHRAVAAENGPAGDDTLRINLYKAIEIAFTAAPDRLRSIWSEETSELQWRSTIAENFFPHIDLSLQSPNLRETQQEQLFFDPATGTYQRQWYRSTNRQWLGEIGVSQPLPTGGSVDLFSTFYQRFYSNEFTGDSGGEREVSQAYRLQVSQEFLQGNLLKLNRDRARLALTKSRKNTSRSWRTLEYRILDAYYSLLTSERELVITREDLEASRETAKLARRKFGSGLIPEVEALQLELEVLQKETNLAQDSSGYEAQLDQFRTLLGLDLEQAVVVVGEPVFEDIEVDPEEALRVALARREELRQAEIDVKLAQYSVKDARRPFSPKAYLSAFVDMDRRDEEWNQSLASNADDFNVNRGLVLSLDVPLWTAGRKSSAMQQAKISLRRSEFEQEQLRRSIVLEVKDAIRSLEEAKKRYAMNQRSLQLAETSYQITRERFENGQVSAREWIEAQLSRKRNRINALRALIDHTKAVARFRLATGEEVVPARIPGN